LYSEENILRKEKVFIMFWLLMVSLIWAFSFGVIKTELSSLDSSLVSFIRLFISLIVFLPFLRLKKIDNSIRLRLFFTGMVQYGVMYLAYIYAFRYLAAYEIALFTIFTPLYITLINDLVSHKFHKIFLLEALLAILATGIIVYHRIMVNGLIIGFILMQISNISFAFGQVYYKKLMNNGQYNDVQVFALLYAGAVVLTGLSAAVSVDFMSLHISVKQFYVLIYLGVIASGIGFFLWNYGARKVNTGSLAVFNNLKIPLAIAVSLIFFREECDPLRLFYGGIILLVILIYNEYIAKEMNA
jgi:drug/metabolite transporter (DMT)-like permease